MPDPKLLDSALTRLQVSRFAELVHLVMPGEGALIVPSDDYNVAHKWAQRRHSTGSAMRDRALLLEKLDTVIARSGSLVSTRGSRRPLEKLVQAMRSAGFSPEEWSLPPDLKSPPKPAVDERKDKTQPAPDAEEADHEDEGPQATQE